LPLLKKILFVPVSLAALAVAGPAVIPAWGQTAGQLNERQELDDELSRRADDAELNGLRGVLEPDQDDASARQRRGRQGVEGLRDTTVPDTETTNVNEANRQSRDTLNRNDVPPTPQPRNQETVDEAELDDTEAEDPYAALGIRLGSFLLFPELTSETVYNDNIFLSSTAPEDDWSLELTPSMRLESVWSRHSLTGTLSGVRSYHDRFTSENDETFEATATGRLDILSTTNLVAEANYSEAFEDRSSTDFPDNAAERPRTRNSDALLEGNHTFNRVTLTLRGNISEEEFDDSTSDTGAIINNSDRDYTEYRLTGRVAYEFQPGVSAFFETSANERDFAEAIDDDGTINGSEGHDVQGGLSFKLSGNLTGEASAGYAIQKPDDASLEDIDGLIFNAGLEWRASGLTKVRLDASSEIAETTEIGSAGNIVRAVELSVEHRPRQHILLGAAVGYEVETTSGSDDEDKEWVIGLTGEYNFSRSVALMIGYEHLESFSSDPGSDYAVDEVRMGLRLRR
jgi:hypothetical protein